MMDAKVPVERQIGQTVLNLTVEGHLIDFKRELEIIVANIYKQNCGIVCEKYQRWSWITQTPHNKNRSLIHIALMDRKTPVDIIWSILHEFGHVLQDVAELPLAKKDPLLELAREKDAWDKAETEVKKYPKLALLAEQFYSYRDKQLTSYNKGS